MTLSTTINDSTLEAIFHAAQHNEVNTDVLRWLAGVIGNPGVTLTGTPAVGNAIIATSATTADWGPLGSLTPTALQAASFTAAAGNRYPLDTRTAAVAVALPSSPNNGDQVGLKWWLGTNAPTVTGTIDGVSGFTFSTLKQDVVFQYNAALSSWMAV